MAAVPGGCGHAQRARHVSAHVTHPACFALLACTPCKHTLWCHLSSSPAGAWVNSLAAECTCRPGLAFLWKILTVLGSGEWRCLGVRNSKAQSSALSRCIVAIGVRWDPGAFPLLRMVIWLLLLPWMSNHNSAMP